MKAASHLPGAPCWDELSTPDIAAAHDFYGGIMPGPGAPPDVAPVGWAPSFAVRDTTAARASREGGLVVSPPKTLDNVGRVATLLDRHSAAVSVIRYEDQ